jgi:RNA polymerase sigma factor rpoD
LTFFKKNDNIQPLKKDMKGDFNLDIFLRKKANTMISRAKEANGILCLEEVRNEMKDISESDIEEIEALAKEAELEVVNTVNEKENIIDERLEKENQKKMQEKLLKENLRNEMKFTEISLSEQEIEADESAKMLLNEISQNPLLSVLEEKKLFIEMLPEERKNNFFKTLKPNERKKILKMISDNPLSPEEAKEKIITSNMRLIVSIAKKYVLKSSLELTDLVSEGAIGLTRATEKFEIERGYKFSTYATYWIRQQIIRAIAEQSKTIRTPVHVNEILQKVRKVQNERFQNGKKEYDVEKLSEILNIPIQNLKDALESEGEHVSLNKSLNGEEEGETVANIVGDKGTFASPYKVSENKNLAKALNEVLDTLDYREAMIVRYRFGFCDDGVPKTLEEVARIFKITRERVRQLETKALRKLRHPSKRKKIEDFR